MKNEICKCMCHIQKLPVKHFMECCYHTYQKYLYEDKHGSNVLDRDTYKSIALTRVRYNTGDVIWFDPQTKFVAKIITHDGHRYDYEWNPEL